MIKTFYRGLVVAGLSAVGLCGWVVPAPVSANPVQPIVIAGNLEISGKLKWEAWQVGSGINIAVNEINEAGGILGRKVQFVVLDNKSDPAEASKLATGLSGRVAGVIGPVGEDCLKAVVSVTDWEKVPLLVPVSGGVGITVGEDKKIREYVFRTSVANSMQGTILANFIGKQFGAKDVVLLYDSESVNAKEIAGAFKGTLVQKEIMKIASSAYKPGGVTYSVLVEQIAKRGNVDAVFISGNYRDAGIFIRELRKAKVKAPIVGPNLWDNPDLVKITGEEAINNTFHIAGFAEDNSAPQSVAFKESYLRKYKQLPTGLATEGYDSAKILFQAIGNAGSTEPEKVKQALHQLRNYQGVSGDIEYFTKRNDALKSLIVLEGKDKKVVFSEQISLH